MSAEDRTAKVGTRRSKTAVSWGAVVAAIPAAFRRTGIAAAEPALPLPMTPPEVKFTRDVMWDVLTHPLQRAFRPPFENLAQSILDVDARIVNDAESKPRQITPNLTLDALLRLRNRGVWLDDSVIDHFAAVAEAARLLLQQTMLPLTPIPVGATRFRQLYLYNADSDLWTARISVAEFAEKLAAAARNCTRRKAPPPGDFVAVLCISNAHWITLCARSDTVTVYDSLGATSSHILDKLKVVTGFASAHNREKGAGQTWRVVQADEFVQQQDTSSCGLFSVWTMLAVACGAELPREGSITDARTLRQWLARLMCLTLQPHELATLEAALPPAPAAAVKPVKDNKWKKEDKDEEDVKEKEAAERELHTLDVLDRVHHRMAAEDSKRILEPGQTRPPPPPLPVPALQTDLFVPLQNRGTNSCFLNAALQCVMGIRSVVRYVLETLAPCPTGGCMCTRSSRCPLKTFLHHVYDAKLLCPKVPHYVGGAAVMARKVMGEQYCIDNGWKSGEQHDAAEPLRKLLGGALPADTNPLTIVPYLLGNRVKDGVLSHCCVVARLCKCTVAPVDGGCSSPLFCEITNEGVWPAVQVDLGDGDVLHGRPASMPYDIAELLRGTFSYTNEKRCVDDGKAAERKHEYSYLLLNRPDEIVLYIKRSAFRYTTRSATMRTTAVNLPDELDLSPYCATITDVTSAALPPHGIPVTAAGAASNIALVRRPDPTCKYSLCRAVQKTGSADSGHFVCYAFDAADSHFARKLDDEWQYVVTRDDAVKALAEGVVIAVYRRVVTTSTPAAGATVIIPSSP